MLQAFDVVTVLMERINLLSARAGAQGGEQVLLWWESRGICGSRSRLEKTLKKPSECALLSARLKFLQIQETQFLSNLEKTFKPQMGGVMTFIIIFSLHSALQYQNELHTDLCYTTCQNRQKYGFGPEFSEELSDQIPRGVNSHLSSFEINNEVILVKSYYNAGWRRRAAS